MVGSTKQTLLDEINGKVPRAPRSDGAMAVTGGKPSKGSDSKPKGNTKDRFQTINLFIDWTARNHGLSVNEFAVWIVLWRETKPNGLASISHSQIAARIGASKRAVIRATKALEEAKLIDVVVRGGIGREKKSSIYRIQTNLNKEIP